LELTRRQLVDKGLEAETRQKAKSSILNLEDAAGKSNVC